MLNFLRRSALAAVATAALWQPAQADVVFQDAFSSGPAVNTSKWWSYWHTDADCPRAVCGNGDRSVKIDDAEKTLNGQTAGSILRSSGCCGDRTRYLRLVSGGTLKLYAWPVPAQYQSAFWGYPYVSGMISSQGSFSQAYGTWEVRFRATNTCKGCHVAIWLLPKNDQWPPEVDLIEWRNNGVDEKRFYFNSHGETPDVPWNNKPYNTNWNTIKVTVDPTNVTWWLNGVQVRKHSNASFTKALPLYILVTTEMGTDFSGTPDSSTTWPHVIEIDSVKAYNP